MAQRWLRRAAELRSGGAEQKGKTGTTVATVAIYSQEGVARRRQRTLEPATAPAACQRARKRHKMLGGGSCVAPAVSGDVNLDF